MAKKKTFESNIEELEKIINSLEGGNAPLDECIEMFEKGVALSDDCLKMLNDAQQKITMLSEKGESDFNADGEKSDE